MYVWNLKFIFYFDGVVMFLRKLDFIIQYFFLYFFVVVRLFKKMFICNFDQYVFVENLSGNKIRIRVILFEKGIYILKLFG